MSIKVHLRVGDIEIDYEGAEAFLTKQMAALVKGLRPLARPARQESSGDAGREANGQDGDPGPLASFLKSKNVKRNKTRGFLATAEWLHRKGSKRISTSDVTKARKDNGQSGLGNSSQCLNTNIGKGYCERDGKQFFVTDEGREALG